MIQHIQSKHEDICYTCDQCEYNLTRVINLLKHIPSKHQDICYTCNQCKHASKSTNNTHTVKTLLNKFMSFQFSICHLTYQYFDSNSN